MERQGPRTSLPALETRRCCIPMHTYLHRSHAHCTAPFTTSDIPNTFHDLRKCNYSLRKCHATSIQAHADALDCTQVCATARKSARLHISLRNTTHKYPKCTQAPRKCAQAQCKCTQPLHNHTQPLHNYTQ